MSHDNTPSLSHDAALAEAFGACRPKLLAYARRRMRIEADADDVVHDALADAWEARHRFDPSRGPPAAWLTGFVHFAILDAHKRAALRVYVNVATCSHPELVVELDDPAKVIVRDRLDRALATLPDDDRALVLDRVVAERPWEELVAERGRSRQSLMRALDKALEALRRAAIREGLKPDVVSADVGACSF